MNSMNTNTTIDFNYVDVKQSAETFKIILVGEAGVGKSSILNQYMSDTFSNTIQATIWGSFMTKVLQLPSYEGSSIPSVIKLQIWDTAGNEKFRSLSKMFYKDSDCVILCYDSTSRESFKRLSYWLSQVEDVLDLSQIHLVIWSWKIDIDYPEVTNKMVEKFIKEYDPQIKLYFYETSSKLNKGIDPMFNQICKNLIKMKQPKRTDSISLSRKSHGSKATSSLVRNQSAWWRRLFGFWRCRQDEN